MNYCCSFDHILSYDEFHEWTKYIHDHRTNYIHFYYPKDESNKIAMKIAYQAYADREGLCYEFNESVMTIRRAHRETIDLYYQDKFNPPAGRNRMGCSEAWYDCYYAITQTLHPHVVDNMSDEALDALIECVCAVQEALY